MRTVTTLDRGAVVRDVLPALGGCVEALVLPHPHTGEPATWLTVIAHTDAESALVFLDAEETRAVSGDLTGCADLIDGPVDDRLLEQIADAIGAAGQEALTPAETARLVLDVLRTGVRS